MINVEMHNIFPFWVALCGWWILDKSLIYMYMCWYICI